MPTITSLFIESYTITGKVCGGPFEFSQFGFLSYLPPTLTLLAIPNNVLSDPPPTLPPYLTSLTFGKAESFFKAQLDSSLWVPKVLEDFTKLDFLCIQVKELKFHGKFPSNLTVLEIYSEDLDLNLDNLPQTLQKLLIRSNFDVHLAHLPLELISPPFQPSFATLL
jgi:hypothetical protein